MRRGCVWPIMPATPRPSSRQILGSCVVLPEPVSPQRTTTWLSAMACDVVAPLDDGEVVGVGGLGEGALAVFAAAAGAVEVGGDLLEAVVDGAAGLEAASRPSRRRCKGWRSRSMRGRAGRRGRGGLGRSCSGTGKQPVRS